MPDRTAIALALASAAFVSVPVSLVPQDARAQDGVRRRVGARTQTPVGAPESGPFWEFALGPSFSDGDLAGFLAGGVTYQQPLGLQSTWGVHAQGGIWFGGKGASEFSGQVVLFARDPMMGEIGVVAGVTTFSNEFRPTIVNVALEGEYYLSRITLGGAVGVQHDNESHWVAQAGVSIYPTDYLKFTGSGLIEEHGAVGASVGVEYQPGGGFFYIPGMQTVVFAKATVSERVTAVRGGLRFSWGGNGSSLIYADRHQGKNFYGSMVGAEGIAPVDNLPHK